MMRKEDTSVVGIRPRKQDDGQDSSGLQTWFKTYAEKIYKESSKCLLQEFVQNM